MGECVSIHYLAFSYHLIITSSVLTLAWRQPTNYPALKLSALHLSLQLNGNYTGFPTHDCTQLGGRSMRLYIRLQDIFSSSGQMFWNDGVYIVVNESVRNTEGGLNTTGDAVSRRSCCLAVHEHALSRMAGNCHGEDLSILNRDPQLQCNSDTSYCSV
jgi:hypothetical protein